MPTVELIYEGNCPHITLARKELLQAFSNLDITPQWLEWETGDNEAPAYVHQYGSPTIIVNGKDVAGYSSFENANHCRLYRQKDNSISGVPPLDQIISALQSAVRKPNRISDISNTGFKTATIPAIVIALLPKLICPFCWPLYTGILGAIGLNFINYTDYLFPLLTLFLVLTVSGLVVGAKSTGEYSPAYLGSLSSVLIIADKFIFETNFFIYGGLAGLIIAVIWHTRNQRLLDRNSCPSCENAQVNVDNIQQMEGRDHDKT